MRLKKPIALLVATLLLVGCSNSKPEHQGPVPAPDNLVDDSKLTYGTAATFPPFEFKQDAELTGFDIEMADGLAESMGVEAESLDIDFDGLIPALGGQRVDIINSAMYINEERSAKIDFVPYMNIGEALLVKKDSSVSIKKLPEDLSGLTVSVTRGAIGEKYMNDFNEELKEAGLEPMNVMTLPNNQDALAAVASGRADSFDTSTPGAAYTISRTDDYEQATTFALDTQIGIGIRKGDDSMKKSLEAALKEFTDSGKYDELMDKYNLPSDGSLF